MEVLPISCGDSTRRIRVVRPSRSSTNNQIARDGRTSGWDKLLSSLRSGDWDRFQSHSSPSKTPSEWKNARAASIVKQSNRPAENGWKKRCHTDETREVPNQSQHSQEEELQLSIEDSSCVADNGTQHSDIHDQLDYSRETNKLRKWIFTEEAFDWGEEYQNIEASLDVSMFPKPDLADVPQYHDFLSLEDTLSPILVPAPFGSGSKEKDKDKKEYDSRASSFGWGGSYNSYTASGNRRCHQAEEEDDPNNGDNGSNNSGSGSGSNGGREGSGGGDDGVANTSTDEAQHSQAPVSNPAEGSIALQVLNYGSYRSVAGCSIKNFWCCCECGNGGGTGLIDNCPGCLHLRCDHCRQERIRK